MAQQILLNSINKSDTYPVRINVSAPHCCGTVILSYTSEYSEQMAFELPSVTVNIFINQTLYISRAISLSVSNENISIGNIITDIPSDCVFQILPNFDKCAVQSHNDDVLKNIQYDDNTADIWIPIETFPISVIWDNSNVQGGGIGDVIPATDSSYDNTESQLSADNVQDAIDETVEKVNNLNVTLTQDEYDRLSPEEQNNGSYYFIVEDDA